MDYIINTMKGSAGGSGGIFLMLAFFLADRLFGKKRRRRYTSSSVDTLAAIKKDNLRRMQDLTARFTDYTAEVASCFVRGQKRVGIIRELNLGNKVDLRLIDDEIKLFVKGQYVAIIHPGEGSRLKQLLRDNIRFSAFLGGRDLEYRIFNDREFCSILVYYKLPGIPPTKVELKG